MSEQRSLSSWTSGVLGELQLRDYWNLARRRKWWIILTAMGVLICTAVVAWRLPNIYRSEVVILIDPQRVPDNYVSSTVTSNIVDRLSAIQQQVMSPTRLRRLIDTLGLYREQKGRVSDQALIDMLLKSATIQVGDPGERPLGSFRISYRGANPVETAQVANELAAMFIEENLKVRERGSYETAEFLNNELAETKKQLEEKENEIQRVKGQYILDLPESKQFHLETLTNLRTQLRDSQDRVSRAQQEKMLLQSIAANSAPTVDLDSRLTRSPYQPEIQKLQAHLSELRARYGANYPEVRKAQSELDRLNAKAAAEEKKSPTSAESSSGVARQQRNPVVEAQLQKLNEEMEEQTKAQAQLQQQINFHVSKLERVPIFEQKISGMMRDYDTMLNHYRALLDKKLSAEMASSLETRQKAERFLILDPAPVPEKPFGPNRLLITLAGLVGGLAGGIGLAMAVEAADASVRNEREAAQILGKPVLAAVPHIFTRWEERRSKMRALGAVAGTAAGSVAVGLLISYVARRLL